MTASPSVNSSHIVNSISLEHIRNRLDTSVTGICFTTPYATLFVFNAQEGKWENVSYAGPLFLLKKSGSIAYSIALLNTKSTIDVYFELNDSFRVSEEGSVAYLEWNDNGQNISVAINFPKDDFTKSFYEAVTIVTNAKVSFPLLPTNDSWKTAKRPKFKKPAKNTAVNKLSNEIVTWSEIHARTMDFDKAIAKPLNIPSPVEPVHIEKKKEKKKKAPSPKNVATVEKENDCPPPTIPKSLPPTPVPHAQFPHTDKDPFNKMGLAPIMPPVGMPGTMLHPGFGSMQTSMHPAYSPFLPNNSYFIHGSLPAHYPIPGIPGQFAGDPELLHKKHVGASTCRVEDLRNKIRSIRMVRE